MNSNKKTAFVVCAGIILGLFIGLAPMEFSWPIAVIAVGLVTGIVLILSVQPDDHAFLTTVFLGGFLLRIILSFTLYLFSFIKQIGATYLLQVKYGFFLGRDDYNYSANAWGIVEEWKRIGSFPPKEVIDWVCLHYSANTTGYDYWNSFVYYVTGKSPFTMFFINCLVGTLTAIFAYFIARRLFDRKSARISCAICMFWPSLVFWSTLNLKGLITVLLIMILVWCWVNLAYNFRFRYFLIIPPCFLALYHFRDAASFLMFFVLIFVLILTLAIKVKLKIKLFVISLFILILPFSIKIIEGQPKLKELKDNVLLITLKQDATSIRSFLKQADYLRKMRNEYAESAFLQNADFSTPLGLAKALPISLLFVLFAPFPWHLGGQLQAFGAAEMLLFYPLVFYIFRGFLYCFKNKWKESAFIISFIILSILSMAMLEGNVGTIFRHREIILPFMFIFAGIGFSLTTSKKIILKNGA